MKDGDAHRRRSDRQESFTVEVESVHEDDGAEDDVFGFNDEDNEEFWDAVERQYRGWANPKHPGRLHPIQERGYIMFGATLGRLWGFLTPCAVCHEQEFLYMISYPLTGYQKSYGQKFLQKTTNF